MGITARIFGAICVLSLACTAVVLAAEPVAVQMAVPLVVRKGTPLYLELDKEVQIQRAGTPVRARVIVPVYAFDRIVIPAGSEVEGQLTNVQPVSRRARLRAILAGDFTPLRTGRVEFHELILRHGRRIPIRAVVTEEAPGIVHLHSRHGSKKSTKQEVSDTLAEVKQDVKQREQEYVQDVKGSGKWERLKRWALSKLPYHKQDLPAGMYLVAELRAPVDFGTANYQAGKLTGMGTYLPPASIVHARLVTPLSSRTVHPGSAVEAVVTQPLLSFDGDVLLPQGTLLEGTVTRVHPARWLSRNGQLDFTIDRIEIPGEPALDVTGNLRGLEVSSGSHLRLRDDRGIQGTSSKLKYFIPGIDVSLTATSVAGAGRAPRAALEVSSVVADAFAGTPQPGVSFGLVGSAITLVAQSHALIVGFSLYGAAWSVYSHLLLHGNEVVLPRDTPLDIRIEQPVPAALPPAQSPQRSSSAE